MLAQVPRHRLSAIAATVPPSLLQDRNAVVRAVAVAARVEAAPAAEARIGGGALAAVAVPIVLHVAQNAAAVVAVATAEAVTVAAVIAAPSPVHHHPSVIASVLIFCL